MRKGMLNRNGEENYNSFGSLMTITKYINCDNIDVYFPEYNWTFYNSSYKEFKNGHIKCPYEARYCNMGYLGEGKYTVMESNNIKTDAFIKWMSMLNRCYSGKYTTYEDCYVCDEWLNYQNFAEWYELNYYEINGEIMCLDKDILIKHNKMYSPDTCVFVPSRINNLFIKSNRIRGNLPIGVTCKDDKYIARCKNGYNKRIHLGTFNTPEEAFYAYKNFKELIIRQTADEYINYIPYNLYIAMCNYEVEIND